MDTNGDVLLEMRNISKSFPGVKAVDNVTLRVRRGTVHALVGENGAGKSTLMKILAGEHRADEGEISFKGEKVQIRHTVDALKLGIATIYQELNLVSEMSIADNLFLGREPLGKSRLFVNAKEISARAATYLDDVGLTYNRKTKVKHLSVAAQQMVEIAKGIHQGAELIVMDEPTSALSENEIKTLYKLVGELKAKGISFIFISHKMDEVFAIADEVTIMRDGAHVTTQPATELDAGKVVALMVGRELTEMFPKTEAEIGEVVLEATSLTRRGVFENVSFEVRRGEILGIAGLMGAGRTEMARALFGLDPLDSGEIKLEGQRCEIREPSDAIRRGIVYLPEDRKETGLLLDRSVLENISLPNLELFLDRGLLNVRRERSKCGEMAQKLRVKTTGMNVPVKNLSGGNQQKACIAKWLLGSVKVLILDEPTRGIDVGAKSEIHRLISELAAAGLAIVMISSELPEVLGMSDRVLVMKEGTKTGELPRSEATQEQVMTLAALGGLEK